MTATDASPALRRPADMLAQAEVTPVRVPAAASGPVFADAHHAQPGALVPGSCMWRQRPTARAAERVHLNAVCCPSQGQSIASAPTTQLAPRLQARRSLTPAPTLLPVLPWACLCIVALGCFVTHCDVPLAGAGRAGV